LSSMQVQFRLVSTNSPVTATTDSSGHYTAVANAGVYYLSQLSGNVTPGGSIFVFNVVGTASLPHYDVTTSDLTQDFQLPTTTLTLTVKDGFGNTVSNAPVSINASNSASAFGLNPADPAGYINNNSRNGTTNNQGALALTVFKTA